MAGAESVQRFTASLVQKDTNGESLSRTENALYILDLYLDSGNQWEQNYEAVKRVILICN